MTEHNEVLHETVISREDIHRRVLLFSVAPLFGGAETYHVKLAKLMRERYVIGAVATDPQLRDQFRSLGIPVWTAGRENSGRSLSRYPGIALSLARAIREFKPDAVHLNGQAESYFSVIPRIFGIPAISTRHTAFDEHISALKRFLVTQSLRIVKRTVCVSLVLKQQLAGSVNECKLEVIPNWLDPMPEPSVYLPPKKGETLRLLYVGRLIREKGIFDLIEAVRSTENVSLDVVGEGADGQEACGRAGELPIRFHGFQADCSLFYRAAHMLVFPSSPCLEGHPQVPIEAMAHGLPSLISNIPVNLDSADQGRAAELYQWGDVNDLVSKIKALQDNPRHLAALSARGAEHVHRCYTKERAREQYFKVFDDATAEQ